MSKHLIAFDIGIKNLAYSIFSYTTDASIIRITTIKDTWKKERALLDGIITTYNLNAEDHIIIEQQIMNKYIKIMTYIKGFFEGRGFKNVLIVKPFTFKLNLGEYIDRKRFSVQLFERFLELNSINYSALEKMDDISDSFNLGIIYLGKLKNNFKKINIDNINYILRTFDILDFNLINIKD